MTAYLITILITLHEVFYTIYYISIMLFVGLSAIYLVVYAYTIIYYTDLKEKIDGYGKLLLSTYPRFLKRLFIIFLISLIGYLVVPDFNTYTAVTSASP